MSRVKEQQFEFGDCRFDGSSFRLWRDGELTLLAPKAGELLSLLLERNGEYVSKEEIFERVWADTFVEEGVLTQNIYVLRKAVGNSVIENKTRLGYRITVPVTRIATEATVNSDTKSNDSGRRRTWPLILLVSVIVALTATAVVFWPKISRSATGLFRKPIESVKFTQLTNSGDVSNAALSPDAKFMALSRGREMFLMDLASGQEIKLPIPDSLGFGTIEFSPDGNSIYFRDNSARYSGGRIRRTSKLGGNATVIAESSTGSFAVSPDNKFLAHYEFDGSELYRRLVLRNLETNESRQLLGQIFAGSFCRDCVPAWSPDGTKIVHVAQWWGSQLGQMTVIDVATGRTEELAIPRLRRIGHVGWFPDGRSLVVSASEDGRVFHLWKVSYPGNDVQALTVGLVSYSRPIVSADGKSILALQSNESANLYVADASDPPAQRSLTTGNTNRFGQMSLIWADNSRIVYSAINEGRTAENLWITSTDSAAPKQLTSEDRFPANAPASDGKSVFYNINRNRMANINRVSLNGEGLTFVTDESDGNRRSPQVSPNGLWLYFVYFDSTGSKIMRRNLIDNVESVLIENENVQCTFFLSISPDGKSLACFNSRKNPVIDWSKHNAEIAVIPVDNPEQVRFIQADGNRHPLHFSPDGRSLEFTANVGSESMIVRQPIDGAAPKPIVRVTNEVIFNFAWSKDGKTLALSRGQQLRDAVLLSDFEK